ncbi:hypothetical protein HY570_00970 [Candidatus Micrarchaeota archaeon]|nr:hypothetical protein [Candidatus Micrarchaeota archaeon]
MVDQAEEALKGMRQGPTLAQQVGQAFSSLIGLPQQAINYFRPNKQEIAAAKKPEPALAQK